MSTEARNDDNSGTQTVSALIIDDETVLCEALTDILTMEGLKVYSAESGEEGIRLFQSHGTEIKIVLLDMRLPGMSGKETLEALHGINPDVKAMVLSGYSQDEVKEHFAGKEVAAFLQKPYTTRKLIARLQEVLAQLPSP